MTFFSVSEENVKDLDNIYARLCQDQSHELKGLVFTYADCGTENGMSHVGSEVQGARRNT